MKKNLLFMLFAMLSMALCCCDNTKTKCNDCSALDIALPQFDKKFPEKRVSLDPDYNVDEKPLVLAYSSLEEAEYKLANCVVKDDYFDWAGYDFVKQVIQSDASSMSYPFDSLVKKQNFTIVDSDDGQVRCYGWCHLNGTRFMNPVLMIQYKGNDGHVYTVKGDDFDGGDYVPEDSYSLYPEKTYRFENGDETYTIIWGLYGIEREVSYYGLVALKLEDDGVHSVSLFQQDELMSSIDVSYCMYDSDEYKYELIRFDKDEPSFYFPNLNERYVWDGNAFVLKKRDEDEAQRLILTSIANGDKETFADLVCYPLHRQYPLKDINTKKEMVEYFDIIFDDGFRKTIGSLKPNDWHEIGWRGFTVLSGDLWEDGGELVDVNYSSPAEQKLRDSLIKAELDALHPSLQGNWEPIDRLYLDDDQFAFARIDKNTTSDTLYRLSLFATNAKLNDRPVACLNGYVQLEGNMGDGYYYFKSQDTVAIYSFGIEHEECVPVSEWSNLLWMGQEILCKGHYYQLDSDF